MTQSLPLQSMLFVPGAKPDRFAKALASGADAVCIDLEDAVPADCKDLARKDALAALGQPRLVLRMNGLRTAAGLMDLLAIATNDAKPNLLFIPMVESAAELEIAAAVVPDTALVPLIETVRGLRAAHEIAAMPQVKMMMFGGGDLSSQLGVALAWEPLLAARSEFIMACAGAGKPAIDVPFVDLGDSDGLSEECRRAKALGFSAKAAIHPAQVDAIHMIFRPTKEELVQAEAAVAAFAAANGAAVRFEGRMLEAPLMRRYRELLVWKENYHA